MLQRDRWHFQVVGSYGRRQQLAMGHCLPLLQEKPTIHSSGPSKDWARL